jgi:hypothetical protein
MPDEPWNLLVQPDQRSCGATVLVVARMLGDPAYAAYIDGTAVTSTGGAAPLADTHGLQERFRLEALAMHRRITGMADVSGKPQIPWPRTFGTPPWAVARQLSSTPAADGRRSSYSWHVARTSLSSAYDQLLAAARSGRVAGLYIGSTWIPRHVVLVVDATPQGTLHVYDPARGRLGELGRTAFVGSKVDIAGWDVPWFVITPDS